MFCQNCGKEIADNSMSCTYCGAPTPAAKAQQPAQQYQQPMQYQQPAQQYQQPGQPYQQPMQYQQPGPYQQPYGYEEPANGGFIALSILIPIVGIILGCVSMSDGKKKAGKTYLTAGLIAAGVYLLIVMIICIAVASSTPYYYYY